MLTGQTKITVLFCNYKLLRYSTISLFIFSRNKANNYFLVNCLETAYVTSQNDRQTQILSGQIVILALTGRYFEPWSMLMNEESSKQMNKR